MPSEQALVKAAQAGDRKALNQLLKTHYDQVFLICRRVLGNHTDAADATQNALIAIVKGLPRFDHRSKFSTWIYRIATNAALDETRRRSRRPQIGMPDTEPIDPSSPDPASQVTNQIVVTAALEELSEEFRVAVVLRDVAGMDYEEISQTLNIPIGTVRSRIARARAQLADKLSHHHGELNTSDKRHTTNHD